MEVRRQKPEEKHLITLFELRSPDFSHTDSFRRTPVKKKKFIKTKVTVINLTAVQIHSVLTNNLKIN